MKVHSIYEQMSTTTVQLRQPEAAVFTAEPFMTKSIRAMRFKHCYLEENDECTGSKGVFETIQS